MNIHVVTYNTPSKLHVSSRVSINLSAICLFIMRMQSVCLAYPDPGYPRETFMYLVYTSFMML